MIWNGGRAKALMSGFDSRRPITFSYNLSPRFFRGAKSSSSDFFPWPEAIRPIANSEAMFAKSVVRECSCSYERDSWTEGS